MRLLLTLTVLLTSVAGRLSPAEAARFFHGETRKVRACVLLLPSTAPARGREQNPNPFVFFAMDRRTDIRPDSWEFVNPLAPATVTAAMAARWSGVGPAPLTVGIPLSKDLAPYWEVSLRPENIEQLVTMDVCYVSAAGLLRVTHQEREMLRRIVDAGALLWLDDAGGLNFPLNGDDLFFPVNFTAAPGAAVPAVPSHPLLNGLFRLTGQEAAALGIPASQRGVVVTPPAAESSGLVDPTKPGLPRTSVLTPVVGTGSGTAATVAAAQYGSGFILATARNVGNAISAPLGPGPRAGQNLTGGQNEDLKLAYNAIAWTDAVTHMLKDPRRTGASGSQLAGFLERWSFTPIQQPATPSWLQPLVVRNQVLAALPFSQSNPFGLFSLATNPADDFNGDGQPDDGVPDLSWGLIQDQIAGGPLSNFSWISGLAYGEVNGVGYVFVTGGKGGVPEGVSAGTTYIQAFAVPTPENPNFVPVGQPFAPTSPPAKDVNVRNIWSAPAFFDGLLVAAGGTQGNSLESGNVGVGAVGDMRAVRLVNGQLVEQWHYPQGNAPEVGPIVGPVVIANVFDERSGATDTMVLYTSLTIASSPGGVGAIVIHTAGEPLTTLDDGRTWAPTRRVENWDPNQWFDIRVIDKATGNQADRFTPATQATRPVQLNVENQPGRIRLPTAFSPTLFTVVAEYSLLNTREGSTGGVVRRYWMPAFNPPGGNLPSSGISAGPSVDAYGNVYVATGNGYIASLKFTGGATIVNWKARVLAAAEGTFLGQQHVWEPYKQGRLSDHLFVSTPAWKDGILYAAGRDGLVYAFETREAFTIKVPFSPGKPPMSPNRPLSVVLYSNESDPGAGGEPPRTNRVPPDAFTVNADAGTITIRNMRNVTLDLSRRTPQRMPELGNRYGIPINVDYTDVNGQAQQDISYIPLNLLYAFQTGGSGAAGSPWRDPFIFETSPVVAGDHVFIIGNRRQSGARNELGPAFLFQLPADPRRLDNGFVAGEDIGSWVSASPGSTRQPGWMVEARQVSAFPVLAPPTVADDLLLVATVEGVIAFKAARVLIADANRIVEVGTDGKVAATMDSTQKLVAVGSDYPIPTDPQRAGPVSAAPLTAVSKNLDRPAVAKRLNRSSSVASIFYSSAPTESGLVGEHSEIAEESVLIADTGNNRIVETNPGGKVIWELTSFQDPFRLLPPGEPLKLADPVDVQRWVDTEQAGGETVLVIHTLVADAGNTRVIEIVDKVRYQNGNFGPNTYATIQGQVDAQGNPIRWHHVLVWTSQTNAQGLKLRYRTAQRVYASDEQGNLIRNPGVSPNQYPRPVMQGAPWLPVEPYESRTMAVVSNAKVYYEENQQAAAYGDTLRNLPQARPGGDSIVFLKSNRTNTAEEPFWRRDSSVAVPNGIVYVQGTIGRPPEYPIILEILDAQGQQVHQLNGVTSLQRTLRVNPADRSLPRSPSRPPEGGIYYLIADASGVFEFRHDPSKEILPPSAGNPFPRDLGVRLAWAFTNDDYNWVTGGSERSDPTGAYTGGRRLTAASARLLTNGQVLIASRTAGNPPPGGGPPALTGEVYTLRIADSRAPASGPFWIPDLWVQNALGRNLGLPSITWRAPSAVNPLAPPSPMPGQNGFNPLDMGNTYIPDQPAFADLVF